MDAHPPGAGKSSFDLIDSERFFREIALEEGHVFLDLGCGTGNYSIRASEAVGQNGRVYSVDLWEDGIKALRQRMAAAGIKNIKPLLADAGRPIPLDPGSVDICLMATVFHDLVHAGNHEPALTELKRVLRRDGRIAIVEFEKIDGPPGPPRDIRISPLELDGMLNSYGFHETITTKIGPYNYLSLFSRLPV